jgi:hypothetical protein
MKRMIALLLGLALFAGAGAVLARGHGGGHGGGGHGGGFHGGGGHGGGGHGGGAAVFVGHGPGFVGHPRFFRRPVFVGGAVIVGAPFYGYPYYAPYYYPPPYDQPYYSDQPAYIEQPQQSVAPRFYCPDYRAYYPSVQNCPSQWLQVVPNSGGYPQ